MDKLPRVVDKLARPRNSEATRCRFSANNSWEMGRGGFRLDWQPAEVNLFTLQGDVYAGTIDQTFTRLTPTERVDLSVHALVTWS